MENNDLSPEMLPPTPPRFVMWNDLPDRGSRDWEREWFGLELNSEAAFNIRGIGIREPLFNPNVDRPLGTGDWLIMLFHHAPRLVQRNPRPSDPSLTLIIWPPGAPQFYSWGEHAEKETHSWMHVEGTWVSQQIEALNLPTRTPIKLPDARVMDNALTEMLVEMRRGKNTDSVILQNLFENWGRGIRRQIQPEAAANPIPHALVRVRRRLDAEFQSIPSLDELARLAAMSRSHLCHQFREHYHSSISEYVIRKRMAAAQRLLFEVQLRPGEIAEAVGYPDIFQFSKQFKKSFGVSPSEYRRRQMRS